MAETKDAKQYLANLIDEQNSAVLCRAVATHEKNPKIADVYIKLAETEEKHAAIWAARLIGRLIGVSIAG